MQVAHTVHGVEMPSSLTPYERTHLEILALMLVEHRASNRLLQQMITLLRAEKTAEAVEVRLKSPDGSRMPWAGSL
jgi:hypothetical protein